MIILDSDVLSAALKPGTAEHSVAISWLDGQSRHNLGVTTVTVFEVLGGIEALPIGRRRTSLIEAFEQMLRELFANRVLPFDEAAARAAAMLYGQCRRSGTPVGSGDTQIAGIALSQGASVATRNVKHFAMLSVPVVNPWTT